MQFANERLPIVLTLLGMEIDVRAVQPSKTELLMLVKLLGRLMLVKLEHPRNAPSPISVTLSGIEMLVMGHPRNAWLPILITVSGIEMFFNPLE